LKIEEDYTREVEADDCARIEGEEWGIYRRKKKKTADCLYQKWG
jgi:hypothetical protein